MGLNRQFFEGSWWKISQIMVILHKGYKKYLYSNFYLFSGNHLNHFSHETIHCLSVRPGFAKLLLFY